MNNLTSVITLAGGILFALNSHAAKGEKGKPGSGGGDSIPPAQITDLSSDNTGDWAPFYRLSWTSVGDDGLEGRASLYDARFLVDSLLNESNWDQANPLLSVDPTPQNTASNEYAFPYELPQGVDCYIGIKVIDEAGNVSPLSNVVIARGIDHGWTIETVKPSVIDNIYNLDHDLASDGRIGIAYSASTVWNDGVLFTEKAAFNGAWSDSELIQPADSNIRSMAYSPTGTASILSFSENQNLNGLVLSTQWGSGWEHDIMEGNATYHGALSHDQQGNPFICYDVNEGKGKNSIYVLKLTQWNALTQSWESESIDTAEGFRYVSLDMGPNGPVTAYLAREKAPDGSVVDELRYAERYGGQWSISRFGTEQNGQHDYLIAANPVTGKSGIAYQGGVDTGQMLHVLTQNADDTWSEETLSVAGYLRDFKFTPAGTPCVLAHDTSPSGYGNRVLVWKKMGIWKYETILPVPTSGGPGMQGSLVMTPTGVPTVALTQGSNPTIVFAKRFSSID